METCDSEPQPDTSHKAEFSSSTMYVIFYKHVINFLYLNYLSEMLLVKTVVLQ